MFSDQISGSNTVSVCDKLNSVNALNLTWTHQWKSLCCVVVQNDWPLGDKSWVKLRDTLWVTTLLEQNIQLWWTAYRHVISAADAVRANLDPLHLTRFSRCVSVSHLYIQYIGLSMLRHRHADMCHDPVGAGETPLWVVGCNTADEDQMRISDNSRFSCPYHPRHVVSSHCCCEGPHLCENILYFLHRWMQQKKMLCWSPCEQVFLGPRYPASRL